MSDAALVEVGDGGEHLARHVREAGLGPHEGDLERWKSGVNDSVARGNYFLRLDALKCLEESGVTRGCCDSREELR